MTDSAASASEATRTFGQRVGDLVRSGLLSTCKVKATAKDIAAAQALSKTQPSYPIPTLGQWIEPLTSSARDNIQFQSASGILSMNAEALTEARSITFVLDDAESANGKDDDQDGLTDEGAIILHNGYLDLVLCENAEVCEFELDGRILKATIQVARRTKAGNVLRVKSKHSFYMRNN